MTARLLGESFECSRRHIRHLRIRLRAIIRSTLLYNRVTGARPTAVLARLVKGRTMAAAMRFASAHATDAAALTAPPSTPAWTALPAGARQRGIMVIGPTGSGKSRLAIELAAAVGGEVINADVVQMYSGLDVASAKVPASDRAGVPHHLMSFLPPRAAFDVRAFRRMAAAAAADAASRGRVPVVAGGTLYYAQALLRSSLLEEDEAAAVAATVAEAGAVLPRVDGSAAGATSEEPYDRLRRVDAVMAERLHPRDGRKIARALAVFDATGVPYSEVRRCVEPLRGGGGRGGVGPGGPRG